MGHFHYNITSTTIPTDKNEEGSNVIYHDKDCRPELKKVPGWFHVNPISTQIDLESVAYQLSDFKYAKGMNITVDDLLNPKPTEYEPTPANY